MVLILTNIFFLSKDINNDGDYEGGYGFDFSTWKGDSKSYQEGVNMLSKRLLQNGVTSYVPTVITSAPETFASVSSYIRNTAFFSVKYCMCSNKAVDVPVGQSCDRN